MQSNNRKIIAGSGITGLVWKFYHPEFTIISPENNSTTFNKNYLVWIHDCCETRQLIVDLGMKVVPKKSYIGYYHKGWICESLRTEMNLLIIQKKMTEWDKRIDTNFTPNVLELSLSSTISTNYMNTLDVDFSEMIERLKKDITIETGSIIKITNDKIFVKNEDVEKIKEYDILISTMPAPVFWGMYNMPREFKYLPTTNVIVDKKPEMFDERFEMVYYDNELPFSRISYLNCRYAIEFTGVITKKQFTKLFPDLRIVDYSIVPYGRIFEKTENVSPQKNIIFSGRFSEWRYGKVLENVIYQVNNYEK